jgi:hypothetical protein
MLIKLHMCHLTYVTHVYVIKAHVNQARFIKFIWGLCHLNQVYFIKVWGLCIIWTCIIKVKSLTHSLNAIEFTCHIH